METYCGLVRTPTDAIILFEACRIGLLPRVQRRLSEKERQSIKSGSVFVWDEREAGMRRWTDGKSWSASRVSGSFLTYREMEGKRGGGSFDKNASRDGPNGQDADSDGGGPDGYRYKPDGLMKQSFSITTNTNQHLHLISYYSRASSHGANLIQPQHDPSLRHIRPEKGMYPDSTVHEQNSIPAVTRGPMSSPGYAHAPNQSPYAGGQAPQYFHPQWTPPSPMHTPPPHTYNQPYYAQPQYHPGQQLQYPPPPGSYGGPSPYDRPPQHHPSYSSGPPPPPPPPQQHGYAHNYPPPPAPYHNGYSPYPHAPTQSSPYPQGPHPSYDSRPPPEHSHYDPTAEKARNDSHHESRPSHVEASTAQTIPSISAMLNGGSNGEPPARTTSRSPGGTTRGGLQDIPMHKIGFEKNRDMQDLRKLDKTIFKAH